MDNEETAGLTQISDDMPDCHFANPPCDLQMNNTKKSEVYKYKNAYKFISLYFIKVALYNV